MIAHLTLALQLAAAAPGVLSVRAAGRDTSVPLVATSVGAAVSIERLAAAVSVKVERRPNAHWAVHVAGVDLDVAEHVPFMKADGQVIPLAAAPFVLAAKSAVAAAAAVPSVGLSSRSP